MSPSTPVFVEIDEGLRRAGSAMTAAEAHGCACGMLALDVTTREEAWLAVVLEEADEADAVVAELRGTLGKLFETSREQLQDPVLGFFPLIAGDEQPMHTRVSSLAEWCESFLYGLALAGMHSRGQVTGDAAEIIQDFSEIAKAQLDAEDGEENEAAFLEVLEFVRMGALLISEQLQPIKAPPRLQ